MNDLQPYEPETLDYAFPTSLPETPGSLTPYQKQQREIEFEQHQAFQNRRAVTIFVVAIVVATLVATVVKHGGINWTALGATLVGVAVAYGVRNIYTPRGTKQKYSKP